MSKICPAETFTYPLTGRNGRCFSSLFQVKDRSVPRSSGHQTEVHDTIRSRSSLASWSEIVPRCGSTVNTRAPRPPGLHARQSPAPMLRSLRPRRVRSTEGSLARGSQVPPARHFAISPPAPDDSSSPSPSHGNGAGAANIASAAGWFQPCRKAGRRCLDRVDNLG